LRRDCVDGRSGKRRRKQGGAGGGRGGRGRDKQLTGLHFLLFYFFSQPTTFVSCLRVSLPVPLVSWRRWLQPHHSERCVGEGKTTTQQGRRDQGRRGQCARVNLVYYLLYQITTRVSSRIVLVRLPGRRGRVLALCVMCPFGLGPGAFGWDTTACSF